MQCHHKKPTEFGCTDEYSNLVMLHTDVHILIHVKDARLLKSMLTESNLVKKMTAINKFRILANDSKI